MTRSTKASSFTTNPSLTRYDVSVFSLEKWLRDNSWLRHAACGTAPDPDIFFPQHGNTINATDALRAKEYCSVCPVQTQCLDEAQPHGIWGGQTAVERGRKLVLG